MSRSGERGKLSIVLVPEGSQDTRSFAISYRALGALAGGVSILALALTVMAGSWWYLAARASRVSELEREVEDMARDRARVQALVQRLETIEDQYLTIRNMFGSAQMEELSGVWLPPASPGRRGDGNERPTTGASRPSSWPLSQRGFVTQELYDGNEGDHPGLDIAVASDSYIRASGGGTIVDVGEDAVYGRYVVIDHGEGTTTLYGHASATFVRLGQDVRERQVIALSGSTGRSTAPHLHFELLLDGEPADPLTFVEQPG
ncbi:MAG: M23 family metallopeptidase [Longimicrobiales bacterium]